MPPRKPAELIIPPTTRAGRQRVLTNKQMENVIQQQAKEDAAKKRAYTQALRARQANEELRGFVATQPAQPTHGSSPDDDENDEYEDQFEPEEEEAQGDEPLFSARSVPPAAKTTSTPRAVPSPLSSGSSATGSQSRALVRRALQRTPCNSPVMTGRLITRSRTQRISPVMTGRPITPARQYHPRNLEEDLIIARGHVENNNMLTGYPRRGTPTLFSEPDDSSPQPNISDDLDAHPSVLGIRKSPPSREDAERTATMSKRARTEPSGSRNRLCIADFDSLCQSVLKRALSYYRATLNNASPFPSQLEDRDAATDAWVQACTDLNTKVDFEEPLMKLITSRAAQARGHLKTVAQPLVETLYGLGNGKRATRDRVEDLLENNGFIYKDMQARSGLYRHPIIQSIINKTWFRNKTDEGVTRAAYSEGGGISVVTLAIVLTVVECCLDEWVTGESVPVPFTATVYKSKFDKHLARLHDFEAKTKSDKIVPRLCQHLLKMAKKHAKVATTTPAYVPLEDDEITAAKKEWENIEFSDDEED